jgi:PAS domain S-box-containing protein
MVEAERPGQEWSAALQPRAEHVLLGVLAALTVGIIVAGIVFYRAQQASVTSQANSELSSVAELKVHDLVDWRAERIGDANTLVANPAFATLVEQAVGPPARPAPANLIVWMRRIQQGDGYNRVTLLDTGGRVVASVPSSGSPLSGEVASYVPFVLASGRPTFVDFYRNEFDGRVYLGVMAPIVDSRTHRRLGAIYLRIDPQVFLYPYIEKWPVSSRTAETLIVRRDSEGALFLNALRFNPRAALTVHSPLGGARPTPAAMAVSGLEGTYRAPDYRGVDVFSCIRPVPGSDWFLVAKMDSSEALAPLNARFWQLLLFMILALAAAALGVGFLQRWRDVSVYRERLLAESERLWLFDVLASSPSEIYVLDADSLQFTFVNDSALSNLGYSSDEILGMTLPEIEPSFDEHAIRSLQASTGARPQTLAIETTHVRKGRTTYPASEEYRRMNTGAREVLLAIASDTTQRSEAQARLRESEALLVQSQRAAAVGHYVLDILGGVWTSSEVMDELFGIDVAYDRSLAGWLAIVYPEDRPTMTAYLEDHVLRDPEAFDREYRIQRINDHAVRWVRGLGQLDFDESGTPTRMFGVIQDITERKLAELEVRRIHDKLEQIVADRTAQLESANRELEAFSYSVSHDLRAPLRHVSGFVELLAEREREHLDEKGLHYLDVISDSVRQMGVLIDDLLQFSRVGRAEMSIADVDMNEVLREALDPLTANADGRVIEWDIQELPHVRGDRSTLRLVWANLLGNAIKYTGKREKASISVGAREAPEETVFFVRDNGVGFDMDYSGKLFGVFQRLHSASEFEGTGIGLANVSRVVTRHGGKVWAEAKPDEGASFYFSIPRRKG